MDPLEQIVPRNPLLLPLLEEGADVLSLLLSNVKIKMLLFTCEINYLKKRSPNNIFYCSSIIDRFS